MHLLSRENDMPLKTHRVSGGCCGERLTCTCVSIDKFYACMTLDIVVLLTNNIPIHQRIINTLTVPPASIAAVKPTGLRSSGLQGRPQLQATPHPQSCNRSHLVASNTVGTKDVYLRVCYYM